jgi:hypothetical protein
VSESKSSLTDLFWLLVIVWIFLVQVRDIWQSKTLYAMRYTTDSEHVFKEPRPVDCDFLGAPIGEKGCHYTPDVSTLTYIVRDNGYGKMFWSDDNGKTWTENDKGLVTAGTNVYVGWKKATDY